MIIGAQMYTTRESCQTLEGFGETLSRIADIGYKTVQVSGTCPFEGEWLKDQLARTGLKCVLTHTPPKRLLGELDQVAADHDTFGCEYVGLGYWSFDPERDQSYEKFMATWPEVGRKLKEKGKYFMYHNHDREFQHREGNINFDRVFEKAEAGGTRYMLVEQDDCHGEDPMECLRRSYRYLKACGFD